MAKKKVKEEAQENEREESRSDTPGGAGAQGAGEQGAGAPSESGGGAQGESGGAQGESGGEGGGVESGGGSSQGGEREGAKIDLLQRIRSQRANGFSGVSSNPDGASNGNSQGNENGVPRNNGGAPSNDGSTPRTNRTNRRGDKQANDGNGGTRQSSSTNESSNRVSGGKPQGVDIKGVDKIKALAQKAAAVEPPKLKFQWDEKPLTNKEGEEILPKIKALLEFVFRHMDKGITVSNRNRAEAHIWSNIDNEDIEIISSHLVEMGKGSKVVATAVRRMTNSYRLLQIGLITLPKFIQTFQFYQSNGGFALIGGK